jgi:hypothetical protein
MDYMELFLNIESALHPQDKSHWIMVCFSLYIYWIWLGQILLRMFVFMITW